MADAGRRRNTGIVAPTWRPRPSPSAHTPHRYRTQFGRAQGGNERSALSRRQHHHDLAALEPRFLLDLGELGGVVLDAVEQLGAQLLVRHLAAAKAQRHLYLV